MNILLVLPRVFANIYEPEHFPTGMGYVSSSLKKAGYNVTILNLNFEEGDVFELLKKYIKSHNIDIVETGGLVTYYWMLKQIVDSVKSIDPNIYTLIGGGYITGDPETAMAAITNADFGVIGEGEITNVEVSRAINGEIPFTEVKGLIFRERLINEDIEDERCIKNPPREEITNLDDIPWPDYEGFSLDKMLDLAPKRYVTMSTGRSCKFRCTFCFHTSGQKYRQRSLNSFFGELDYLVKKYAIDNIYITDEMFADDAERLNEFCRRIKEYNILWSIQLRVNIVTKELLQLLKDSGCIIISFGLESADNAVLKSMRKGITIDMIENALKCSYEVGIEAHGAFIFGDIAENKQTIANTLSWWNNHRYYNVALALIQVFPGTYLYEYACKNGIIKDKVEFIRQGCPYINVSQLTDKEYFDLGLRLFNELSAAYPDIEGDITITTYEKNRMDVFATCPHCGSKIVGNRCSISKPTTLRCSQCGEQFTFNPFRYYKDNVEKNIKKLKQQSRKLVFWKCSEVFSAVYRAIPCMKEIEYEIVDTYNILHNQEYMGHIVRDESILLNPDYDTVVVCDFPFATYATNYIKMRYSNKKVIFIGELVSSLMP